MSARGFTLIESLVALVVLSVGLLGAAATLLGSVEAHGEAVRRATALSLVRDLAERIRMNRLGRVSYDTRGTTVAADCAASFCDPPALAAADRAQFVAAARATFSLTETRADIHFEPAIGPTAPDRYDISLRYAVRSQPGAMDGVALTVLVYAPVAGA